MPRLATCFGLGYLSPGSGTWASLITAIAIALAAGLTTWLWAPIALLGLVIGTRAVAAYILPLGDHDPSEVVIDEVVGMLFGMAVVGLARSASSGPLAGTWLELGARSARPVAEAALLLGLFRVLDIAKPWPIRLVDERSTSAFGAMFDDVLAGIGAGTLAVLVLAVGIG